METKNKITKKDVSKSFAELRGLPQCIVFNFSSDRKNRGSFIGKTDYEIVSKYFVAMVELKLYDDKLSDEQISYGERITNIGSDNLIYLIATHENYTHIKSAIASRDMVALRIYKVESSKILVSEKLRISNIKKRIKK